MCKKRLTEVNTESPFNEKSPNMDSKIQCVFSTGSGIGITICLVPSIAERPLFILNNSNISNIKNTCVVTDMLYV